MVFIIRFSIVPSHFSTAVFATCDVKFWHFAVATFLTLPKQIFIVYLGVLLVAQDENNRTQTIVLVITFVITCVMGVYIWFKMKKAKVLLLQEQAARQANHSMVRLTQAGSASSTTEAAPKPAGGAGDSPGGGAAGMMWNTNTDARQDMPLGYSYAPEPSHGVGMAVGDPADLRPGAARYDAADARPELSRYDASDVEAGPYPPTATMPAGPYYAMEQKPYYQKPSVQDATPYPSQQPQSNREWV